MVTRKVIAGTAATVAQVYFKKGTLVPQHAPGTEAIVYVLQGAMQFSRPDGDTIVREGEVIVLGAGRPYQAETLDDTFVLVVRAGRAPAADRAPQRDA